MANVYSVLPTLHAINMPFVLARSPALPRIVLSSRAFGISAVRAIGMGEKAKAAGEQVSRAPGRPSVTSSALLYRGWLIGVADHRQGVWRHREGRGVHR